MQLKVKFQDFRDDDAGKKMKLMVTGSALKVVFNHTNGIQEYFSLGNNHMDD